MYKTRKNSPGLYLSPEGKAFKNAVGWLVANQKKKAEQWVDKELQVRIHLFSDWHNKGFPKSATTKIKRKDIDNPIKHIFDAVFDNLPLDDSQIFDFRATKETSNTEGFVLTIELTNV